MKSEAANRAELAREETTEAGPSLSGADGGEKIPAKSSDGKQEGMREANGERNAEASPPSLDAHAHSEVHRAKTPEMGASRSAAA